MHTRKHGLFGNQQYSSYRRFDDFNPPQCTKLTSAVYFLPQSLLVRQMSHLGKYSFNREALPFTSSYGAARFSSSADSEAKTSLGNFKNNFLPQQVFWAFLNKKKRQFIN